MIAEKPAFVYLFLAVCTLIAILIRGYSFGTEDQNLYLPFVLHWQNPSLFPHDALLTLGYAKESIAWRLFAWMGEVVTLKTLFLVIYVSASYTVLLLVYKTALAWWHTSGAAWLAVFLWIPSFPVPGVANPTFDSYLTTRILGTLLGLLAIYLFIRSKDWWLGLAFLAGTTVHVISILPVAAGLGLACLVQRRWKALFSLSAGFSVGAATILFMASSGGLNHQMFMIYDSKWLSIVKMVDHELFPNIWPAGTWYVLLIYIAIFYALYFLRNRQGGSDRRERSVVTINTGIIALSVIGLIGVFYSIAILIQICTFRGYLLFIYLLTIYFAGVVTPFLESNKGIYRVAGIWLAASWVTGDITSRWWAVVIITAFAFAEVFKRKVEHHRLSKEMTIRIILIGCLVVVLLKALTWFGFISLAFAFPAENALFEAATISAIIFVIWKLKPGLRRSFGTALFPVALSVFLIVSPSTFMVEYCRDFSWIRKSYGTAIVQKVVRAETTDRENKIRRKMCQLVKETVPENGTVIVPPDWKHFRVWSWRSPFVTYKDGAPVEFSQAYAFEWEHRIHAVNGYGHRGSILIRTPDLDLSEAEVRRLASDYSRINLCFIITTRDYTFPLIGRAGRYKLFRIESSASTGTDAGAGCFKSIVTKDKHSDDYSPGATERVFTLESRDPRHAQINILNKGDHTARFHLILNGQGFYSTVDDIISTIKAMSDEIPNEKLVRKVWRFTRDNFQHSYPLTSGNWINNPAIFLNSIGFGFCDDAAILNSELWKQMGLQTRIWNLSGHVVSEVFSNGRWEMYDSDMGVYYLKGNGSVAGVKDLERESSLITDPVDKFSYLPPMGLESAYSERLAQMYSSTEDNRISSWHFIKSSPEPVFELPPGGELSITNESSGNIKTSNIEGNRHPIDSKWLVTLRLPRKWRGSINPFLILAGVRGYGKITIWKQSFPIGSDVLNTQIHNWTRFISSAFLTVDGWAEVDYLINQKLFHFQPVNTLVLEGKDLSGCELKIPENSQKNPQAMTQR